MCAIWKEFQKFVVYYKNFVKLPEKPLIIETNYANINYAFCVGKWYWEEWRAYEQRTIIG